MTTTTKIENKKTTRDEVEYMFTNVINDVSRIAESRDEFRDLLDTLLRRILGRKRLSFCVSYVEAVELAVGCIDKASNFIESVEDLQQSYEKEVENHTDTAVNEQEVCVNCGKILSGNLPVYMRSLDFINGGGRSKDVFCSPECIRKYSMKVEQQQTKGGSE